MKPAAPPPGESTMKRTIAVLLSLLMTLSACAGPAGSAGTQGAQSASTGASAETAAAEEPAGNEKPELVIMGQESSNYSRAAESKKSIDVDVKTSALYSAHDIPKLSDKN